MNKLNLMLIASPVEFAAIFGGVTSDATAEARGGSTGVAQGAVTVPTEGSAEGNGFGGRCKSNGVQFFSLEASIGTLGPGREG